MKTVKLPEGSFQWLSQVMTWWTSLTWALNLATWLIQAKSPTSRAVAIAQRCRPFYRRWVVCGCRMLPCRQLVRNWALYSFLDKIQGPRLALFRFEHVWIMSSSWCGESMEAACWSNEFPAMWQVFAPLPAESTMVCGHRRWHLGERSSLAASAGLAWWFTGNLSWVNAMDGLTCRRLSQGWCLFCFFFAGKEPCGKAASLLRQQGGQHIWSWIIYNHICVFSEHSVPHC